MVGPSQERIEGAGDARRPEEIAAKSVHERPCDELISLLAHELRGPLATLTGYAQLLAKKGISPQVEEKATHAVLEQAKRLNVMVDNLLQASRLAADRLKTDRQSADLVPFVRQVVEQQQAISPHHHLILDAPEEAMLASFDTALVGLALSNIIQNAVKFAPRESDILVFLRPSDRRAVISVVDLGPGIAPEELARVFEPYQTERGGMGVGLFVAKGIVEAHGGEIGINSKPGAGTTVWFSLPLGA